MSKSARCVFLLFTVGLFKTRPLLQSMPRIFCLWQGFPKWQKSQPKVPGSDVMWYWYISVCPSWKSEYTVSTKKTHLANFETCVFRVYLWKHLSYKKNIYIYLHSCLRSFQIKKRIFQTRSQNQLIFAKTLFFQKKSKLLEKIRHFEKFKNFFSWI